MSAVRSVRFSELPAVTHRAETSSIGQCGTAARVMPMPRIYDDALFGPYDVFTAASIGDNEVLEHQLKSGFDPNRVNASGWSALMYASYLGHETVCSTLLNYGASVDSTNPRGQTSLMLAATCGNLAVVRSLLKKGADVDKQDQVGETALAHAVACSQTSVAEALLEAGADPNIRDITGMTPTLTACAVAHELTLIAILQNDGDVKIKNGKGEDGEALAADNPKALAILNDPPSNKGRRCDQRKKAADVTSLPELLMKLKLDKYIGIFESENVDLKVFLQLTDSELTEMGVKAFGPRKKMLNAINRYRTEGTFLPSNVDKGSAYGERRSEQVTNELMECQQQLVECQQELRKARKMMAEQQKVLNTIREAGKQSRSIAYSMLEEVRRNSSCAIFEKDVLAIMKNIDNISMKMLEIPHF